MPRGAREKSRSGIYHVMWRGANRQEIFHDDDDCRKLLTIIAKYKTQSDLKVYAWCLMNNHVHLLIKEGSEDLSITMKRMGVSFVSYYNSKYQTVGPLFQGRFKTENVESSYSLMRVVRYIHQNPVKAGMVEKPDEWRWSSCQDYYRLGKYSSPLLQLDSQPVLKLFSEDPETARKNFIEFNEVKTTEEGLDEKIERIRLTDDEARMVIKETLGNNLQIAQVKSLPRLKQKEVLQEIKKIKWVSQRQAARILGIPASLIFKA